jgi:hypothetical protein
LKNESKQLPGIGLLGVYISCHQRKCINVFHKKQLENGWAVLRRFKTVLQINSF